MKRITLLAISTLFVATLAFAGDAPKSCEKHHKSCDKAAAAAKCDKKDCPNPGTDCCKDANACPAKSKAAEKKS